jgi:2-dehydropantoate 2-reductase
MSDVKPARYVIAGAGAIGASAAALLSCRAAASVICVGRPASAAALRAGVVVKLDDQEIEVGLPAVAGVSELEPRAGDVLIVTTKSQDTEAIVEELSSIYDVASVPIVSLQNGVANEGIIASRFRRVYAGLVFFSATQVSSRLILVPPGRYVAFGLYPSGVDELAEAIAEDFSRTGFDSMASAHVMSMKYGKLVANLNNATHAITGYWLELGSTDEEMRRLMLAVREEGIRILDAAGIEVEPPPGERSPIRIREWSERLKRPVDPEKRRQAAGLDERDRTHASTSQDLYFGRRTSEAEFLNGEIVRLGKNLGVPTPYNSALLEIVTAMFERGLQPGIHSPAELHSLIRQRAAGAW